jgi:hypothetical protein
MSNRNWKRCRLEPSQCAKSFETSRTIVDKTLELLAAALRGEKLVVRELLDLREDHHRLIRSANSEMFRFALVNEETDRMTNSLNTQRDQVLHWERLQVAADGLHDRIIRDERASS